jgi:hypothetical protein
MKDYTKVISLRLPSEAVKTLKRIAIKAEMSVSEVIRIILIEGLESDANSIYDQLNNEID